MAEPDAIPRNIHGSIGAARPVWLASTYPGPAPILALTEVGWNNEVFLYNSTGHKVIATSKGVGSAECVLEPGHCNRIGQIEGWEWDFDISITVTLSWPDGAYSPTKYLYRLKDMWLCKHLIPFHLFGIGQCKRIPNATIWYPSWANWTNEFLAPWQTQPCVKALGGKSTAKVYQRPDGTWTPERQALHDQIIEDVLGAKCSSVLTTDRRHPANYQDPGPAG
jgi:hypothetical protein